jgi:hypothetical protein
MKACTENLFPIMAAAILMPPQQIGLLVVPLHTVMPPVDDPRILVGGVLVTLKDRAIIAWLRTPRAGQSHARGGKSIAHAQAIPYSSVLEGHIAEDTGAIALTTSDLGPWQFVTKAVDDHRRRLYRQPIRPLIVQSFLGQALAVLQRLDAEYGGSEGSADKQLDQLRPPSPTSASALPEAEWVEAGTPTYDELLAQADGEISLFDLLQAANPNELPKPTRKLLRVPLEVLPSQLGPQERVERVADAASGSVRGLLVLTTERLVLLDGVSGVLEVEIPYDDCTACVGAEKSILVWSAEGAARFTHISPSSLEPQADSDPGTAGSSEKGTVPRLRVCPECEGEFTPVLRRDTCPDCGGVLIPVD